MHVLDGCAAHRWSFPLHKPRRRFLKIQRGAGCWKLWVFEQLLFPDAVLLQLIVLLVLVRDGRGEHCPDSEGSQQQAGDGDEITLLAAVYLASSLTKSLNLCTT